MTQNQIQPPSPWDDLLGQPVQITEGIGEKRRDATTNPQEAAYRQRQARLAKPTASLIFGPDDALKVER